MSRCHPRFGVATEAEPGPWSAHHMHRGGPFGRGFGGPGPGRGRRGPRARRGDVRAAILRLLTEEPQTGYALMQAIEERSNGVWTPSAGSIYPALSLLEDEGLVRSAERDGKKTFELTEDGTKAAEERSGETAPWDTVRGEVNEDALALMHATKQLGGAVMQVAQAGTPEQAREAKDILDAARKQLFALLAKD
ncbi:MAG: helix-turn-helix transcriptional regulator [Solirubrobacteraceae bacterium]|nr:helix-turn-helix transcriptional regulator [Solirubrobacteraceae bacterium]